MKVRIQARNVYFCCLLILLLSVSLVAQTPNPNNAGIYSKAVAPASSFPNFLASDQGGQMLLHSPSPNARIWLAKFHPELLSQYPQKPTLVGPKLMRNSVTPAAPVISPNCAGALGTGFVFNNEPAVNSVPQNEPPVDFFLNGIPSGSANHDLVVQVANDFRGFAGTIAGATGAYVHRNGNVACFGAGDFELGLPPIAVAATPTTPADAAAATGDPHVIADATRGQVLISDLRFGTFLSGVGLTRIPKSSLLSTVACPSGTEPKPVFPSLGPCIGAGGASILVGGTDEELVDFPQMAQDPRSSGIGAADIVLVWNAFEIFGQSEIHIAVCKAVFVSAAASCSPPVIASGADVSTSWPGVAVVPATIGNNVAGTITISYMSFDPFFNPIIRFATCKPNGAPLAPTCSAPTTAKVETQTVSSLTDNPSVRNNTIPVHADRSDGTIFLVWERCKVANFAIGLFSCPDADIVMSTSTNMGATWSATSPLDATVGSHEIMPAISIDPNTKITNITYYHSMDTLRYKNRMQVMLKQILAGSVIPGAATAITTSGDSPAGDAHAPFFQPLYGDYMGNAAHSAPAGGSHLYVGHNNNSRVSTYTNGLQSSQNTEENNHVSEFLY